MDMITVIEAKFYLVSFIGIALNIWIDTYGTGGNNPVPPTPGALLVDRFGNFILDRAGNNIVAR